jgi:hypothetical protein
MESTVSEPIAAVLAIVTTVIGAVLVKTKMGKGNGGGNNDMVSQLTIALNDIKHIHKEIDKINLKSDKHKENTDEIITCLHELETKLTVQINNKRDKLD